MWSLNVCWRITLELKTCVHELIDPDRFPIDKHACIDLRIVVLLLRQDVSLIRLD